MGKRKERGWPGDPEPLPVPAVDNHTHLDLVIQWEAEGWDAMSPTAQPTLEDHLTRASRAGVDRMVQVGGDLDAVEWTDAAVRQHRQLLGAVAIHPNEAVLHDGLTHRVAEIAPDGLDPEPLQPRHDVSLEDAIARVEAVARGNDRIRAIGETGLDYFRAGEKGREIQRASFRVHIALAKELGLALQIHDRDSHQDVIDLLISDGAPEATVFHCYSGDAEMARICAEHGWYLSFAGPVTFSKNEHLREALRAVPLSLVLAETDAPFLTPHPLRGRPNSPYLLPHTVRFLAHERGESVAEVAQALSTTSASVYGAW